jgi:hypothetical protein
MAMRMVRFVHVLTFVATASRAALAQSPAPAPVAKPLAPVANSNTGPPDLVRLKDGSLLRGTIAELRAGDSVTIVTITGTVRTFSLRDVAYAGPARSEPGVAQPNPAPVFAPPATWRASVTLTSEPAGLAFHQVIGVVVTSGRYGGVGHAYGPLCVAPCRLELSPGFQELALSYPRGLPRPTAPLNIPAGNSELHGYFESRQGLRIAGYAILAGALAGGIALVVTSFSEKNSCTPQGCAQESAINTAPFVAGWTILAVGVPVGIVLAITPDVPHIDVQRGSGLSRAPGIFVSGRL